MAVRARETKVGGHERSAGLLGKRHEERIRCRDRVSQLPHTSCESKMRKAHDSKRPEVPQSKDGSAFGDLTTGNGASQESKHLAVEQMRCERDPLALEPFRDERPVGSAEQVVERRRAIEDDQSSPGSGPRSSRIISAGLCASVTGSSALIRRVTSSILGSAASMLSSRFKYSDKESPIDAARALSARWTSSGTFRI